MKTKVIVLFLLALSLTGCSGKKSFKIGYSPNGSPLTLWVDNSGSPSVEFEGSISTPIGTFKISDNSYIKSNCTYVELINLKDNSKIVFNLLRTNSKFTAETNGYTKIEILNKRNSTIVKIESEEITDYLYVGPKADYKPSFPEQPFPSFWLCKMVNVDWSIDSVWDFLADVIYVIVYAVLGIIDIVLMVVFFVLRIVWWILVLLWYIISSMYK